MKARVVALLLGMLGVPAGAAAEETFPDLARRIPHLAERLRSTRWEARYCLLQDLTGRDAETRRALETLVRDRNEAVANQATVRYVNGFLDVDRAIFKPALYVPRCFVPRDLPAEDADRALVDYCLGRRGFPRESQKDDSLANLPVLDPARMDDPRVHESLTIVGILGKPEDAEALVPFLQAPNAYVALGAAKAVIRLGQKSKGVEALCRIAERDPSRELSYVTEALHVLREMGHPGLRERVLKVLSSVDRDGRIQPNWVNGFLLLAADVAGSEVWRGKEGGEGGEGPR